MARNFHRKRAMGALNDLNVTPLMDLAFSLLIIFMVSTPLLEQTIKLDLPSQKANDTKAETKDIQVINIDAGGGIFWGKQEVTPLELDARLAALASMPDPDPISLRADRTLAYQKVVDVIDMIKRHNLTKLHLDTKAE